MTTVFIDELGSGRTGMAGMPEGEISLISNTIQLTILVDIYKLSLG